MKANKKQERKIAKFRKKHKIGLCLSGGGTKGFSYIGIFKAFEEHNIKFDMVAGTSVGSLFGAMYAAGVPIKQLIEVASKMKTSDFRKSKLGFLPSKMDKLAENIDQILPVKKFEDLLIPFYAVAVDLKTGKEVHINSGNIVSAVTGSCAIPGVFVPVKHKSMLLIDGGVSNNVPADVLFENGCDYVVTLDCNPNRGGGTNSESLITQFTTSVGIMMANNSKKGLAMSDVVIAPNLNKFNSLKVEGVSEMIKEGYKAANENMQDVKDLFMGKLKK